MSERMPDGLTPSRAPHPAAADAGAALATERGSRPARTIGMVAGPALFLAFLLLPDLELSAAQRGVAAVTALVATFWVTLAIPIGATALLPAALFPLLGVLSADEVARYYMHNLVILFIGAFIVALGLERWGVHKRMALSIVAKVGTRPRRLVLSFMLAAAFLSLWLNNTATTLMMLPIVVAVIDNVRPPEADRGLRDPFALCLLLGTAYAASVGGMGTPVGTAPNQQFLGQLAILFPEAPKISFGLWLVAWGPLVLSFIAVAWLVLTYVLFPMGRVRTAGIEVVRVERAKLGRMGRGEVLMSLVFVATALAWVTRADLDLGFVRLPGWSRLFYGERMLDAQWYRANEGYISDSTVALLAAAACFLIPVDAKRGEYLMDWRTARELPWDVLLLLGSGIAIAGGFRASELDAVVGEQLAPLFAGRSSWVTVGGTVLFVTFLTELTSNTATTAVLLPILGRAAVACGIDPLMLMGPATIAASAAFMLPSATPPNAVVFASRRVTIAQMARTGLVLNLVTIVLVTVVWELWVRRVWGVGEGLPSWAGG